MHQDRIKRAADILKEKGFDALFIAPSADLVYVADLKMRPDERLKAFFILADGRVFAISPMIYRGEFEEALGKDAKIYGWDDTNWFHDTVEQALGDYGLKGGRIALNVGVRGVDAVDIQERNGVRWENGESVLAELRMIKDADEVDKMVKSGAICDQIHDELERFIQPGLTEGDVKKYIVKRYEELGADPNSWNPIVGAGPHGAMPHYSGSGRVITENDLVVVDIGCGYQGYRSDITRTFAVGTLTAKQRDVYEAVYAAQAAAQAKVAPGVPACEIDKTARDIMEKAGFGKEFFHRVGHGIGIEGHELPYISSANRMPLRPGMCFSVEPGAYFDGEFGIRIENSVTVTENGCLSFNNVRKKMGIA